MGTLHSPNNMFDVMNFSIDETKRLAKSRSVSNEATRRGLQLKRSGPDLSGPCPVCGGRDRFWINTSKNSWGCRQCSKGGDVISFVQHVEGIDFVDAVDMLTGEQLRDSNFDRDHYDALLAEAAKKQADDEAKLAAKRAQDFKLAMRLWDDATCIWGTPAQGYLDSRCCDGMFPPDRDAVLRYHPRCLFGLGTQPCVVALIRNIETDQPQAIQRTAITPDGKKIERRTLGPKAGGAIKLWPQSAVRDRLVVGEGMETVLSTALHIKDPATRLEPAWALIDAGNLAALPVIASVNTLVVLADHDVSGKGQKAAGECTQRWAGTGREVIPLMPEVPGTDFNDVVMEKYNVKS
jgi:phage/plasmid primase-like uncharacterized protein